MKLAKNCLKKKGFYIIQENRNNISVIIKERIKNKTLKNIRIITKKEKKYSLGKVIKYLTVKLKLENNLFFK